MLQEINEQEDSQKKVQDYKDLLLVKMLSIVSKQKLLPSFLDQFDTKCVNGKKKRLLEYKQTVKKIYSEKNKFPLIYDPEQAYTDRQKLQQKVQKAKNNQLDIDYLEKMRLKQGRIVPTYKGFPLDTVNYPTKKQFQMFQDFNEKKFLKSYSEMFDDKLQLKQPSILRKQRVKTITSIPQQKPQKTQYSLPKPKFSKFKIDELKQKQKDLKKVKKIKLRPLTEAVESQRQIKDTIPKKQVNEKYKPHLQKVVVGKILKDASRFDLYQRMLKIGSFPQSVSQSLISLTKQSLAKYLKQFYERQIRIIDFLQVKPTISLDEYSNLCTKLKLMSVEHVIFMSFLFYDFNNDGYICDNDIRRIKTMIQSKKNHILGEDLKLIEGIKEKKQYQAKILALKPQNNSKSMIKEQGDSMDELNYHELYKLPQITQSTFFQWLNRQKQRTTKYQQRQRSYTQSNQQQQKQNQQQKNENNNQQRVDRKVSNPFNPSVMKFKYNYFDERTQVKKYILNIKSTKTYITFSQFRKKYIQLQQINNNNNKIITNINITERRATQNVSSISKQPVARDHSMIGLSRHKLSRSQIKIQPFRKQSKQKTKEKQKILKPFLWYDLVYKLTGMKYQGLKYMQ